MIKESLYFSFAGRRSTEFGINNVSISGGLFNEQLTSGKSITEFTVRGNPKPYFVETKRDPKQFQLHFFFNEGWNDNLINEVVRWLDVDYYEPLFFSEDIDRVFYCLPIDGIEQIHNGLKQGYLTLNFRCNSPFSYSHEQVTPWIEVDGSKVIEIDNLGHHSTLPDIWIESDKSGSISFFNLTDQNTEMRLDNLQTNEQLYIDCENEILETNLENVYRHDDFNENYLTLVYGKNHIKIVGKAKVKFSYRYIFS
ncbi:phage tail family protein [Cytobacillus kochii]|uniref:phage distal tail protein n=1 Tax=Cytobacillus kochii TaxID=859143 RepID=UPI001CD2080D|nr:phage tail domain-containing protein [Cytobacillus kochii]MCA1025659.1 phage tail family protein [Cytobacillus kochii]